MQYILFFILLILIAILISINIFVKCKNTIFVKGGMDNEGTNIIGIKGTNIETKSNSNMHTLPSSLENGLIIHDTVIKKLSGPISFYYLKPDYDEIHIDEKGKYPLIILFGDWHNSNDFKCVCNSDIGCYQIDSQNFLQLIDSLSMSPNVSERDIDKKFYIDWFTESQFYGTSYGAKGGPMHYFVQGNFLSCYYKNLISSKEYEEKCPTKNIRWHHGDLRYFGDMYFYNYRKNIISPLPKLFREGEMDSRPFELIFSRSYDYFRNEKYYEEGGAIKYMDIDNNKIFTLAEFNEILSNFKKDDKYNLKNFLQYFFKRCFYDNPNGILLKELSKSNINEFNIYTSENNSDTNKLDRFIDILVECYVEFINNDTSIAMHMPTRNGINEINLILNKNKKNEKDDNKCHIIHKSLNTIYHSLIEIYTILRIFKKNDDGTEHHIHNQSALSLLYMGQDHIKRINELICNFIPYYKLKKSIINSMDKLMRCLDFSSFRLNLTEELANSPIQPTPILVKDPIASSNIASSVNPLAISPLPVSDTLQHNILCSSIFR